MFGVTNVRNGLPCHGRSRPRWRQKMSPSEHAFISFFFFFFNYFICFILFLFIHFFFLKFLNAFKTQLEESSECALRDRDSNANLMMADCAFIASSSTSTLVCRRFYGY